MWLAIRKETTNVPSSSCRACGAPAIVTSLCPALGSEKGMFGKAKKKHKKEVKTGPPSYDLDRLPETLANEHALRVWRAIPRWRRWLTPKPTAGSIETRGATPAAAPSLESKATRPAGLPAAGGDVWTIDEKSFPRRGGAQAAIRFCLKYAILAPSSHNSQPWRFQLGIRHVDLLADHTRALSVTDPEDRELVMSCGAALHHLRLAMRCFGLGEATEYLAAAGGADDVLARVRVPNEPVRSTPHDVELLRAIPKRQTLRSRFESRPIADRVIRTLSDVARSHQAELTVIEDPRHKKELAAFVAEADLVQMQDRRFRRELASWMHHNRSHTRDGMPGYSMSLNELESIGAPIVVRTFDVGDGRAAADQDLAEHCGAIVILSTSGDSPQQWLGAGEALADILLNAYVAGLRVSYLNQPIEIEQVRPRLASHFSIGGYPQIVLRLGYSDRLRPRHTPRRSVDDVTFRTDVELEEEPDLEAPIAV